MNKKVLIVLLLLVVGISTYLYFYKPKVASSDFTGSWQELSVRGGKYFCTYNYNHGAMDGDVVDAKFYINGENMLGVVNGQNGFAGLTYTNNILRKGNELYTWNKNSRITRGETPIPTVTVEAFQEKFQTNKNDENYKYSVEEFKCEKWKPDSSLFELPSGINFLKRAKVEIISPNGGKVYRPGDTLVIEWKKENIENIRPSAVWAMILTPYTEDNSVQRYRELDVQLECFWDGTDKVSWVIPSKIEVKNSECPKYISRDGRLRGEEYDDRGIRAMVKYNAGSQGDVEDWSDKQSILTF